MRRLKPGRLVKRSVDCPPVPAHCATESGQAVCPLLTHSPKAWRNRQPPARALTGEVQFQDPQGPDGSPWLRLRARIAAVEPLLLALRFRGCLYALP